MDKSAREFGRVVMPGKKIKRKPFAYGLNKEKAAVDLKKVVSTALQCVFAWLCGSFVIFGSFNPVGIACICAYFGMGIKFYMVLGCVFLGYASSNVYGVVIYITAACACAVAEMFIFSKSRKKSSFLMAFSGGVSLLLGALAFVFLNGLSSFIIARGLIEAVFLAALSLVIREGIKIFEEGLSRRILDADELLCLGTVLAIGAGAIAQKGDAGFNLSLALGTAFLLSAAYKAGIQASSLGVIFGLSFLFLGIGSKELFLMLSTAALLSGVFSKGRLFSLLGFGAGFIIPGFYLGQIPKGGMAFALVLGGVMFLVLPERVLNNINTFQNHKSEFETKDYFIRIKEITESRLKGFAEAFGALALAFETEELPKEVTPKEAGEIVDVVASKVCNNCSMSYYCWRSKSYDAYEGIHKLIGSAEKNGVVQEEDLTPWIRESCVKLKDMVRTVNIFLREYRNNLVWKRRLNESRQVLKEQLLCVEKVIGDIGAQAMPQPVFYESTAKEIKTRLLKKGIKTEKVYVAAEGKAGFTVSITKESCFGKNSCQNILLPVVNSVVGRKFKVESRCEADADGRCTVILKERKGFVLETAAAAMVKKGSEESGDTYYSEETADKKGVMVICDGMGTGREAASKSGKAAELVRSFLRAGFPPGLTVKVLNSALATDSSEVYTTMDICSVDLFTGEAEIIKNGGSTVFIYSKKGVMPLRSSSLPMGVLKDWQGEVTHAKLKGGDIIIMVTDGVSEALGIENEAEEVKKAAEAARGDVEGLAAGILKTALKKSGGTAKDDMTVLVGRVC